VYVCVCVCVLSIILCVCLYVAMVSVSINTETKTSYMYANTIIVPFPILKVESCLKNNFRWQINNNTWQSLKYEKFNTAHSIIARCQRQCIEVCSANQSAQSAEKNFHLHLSAIRVGSHGTFLL